MIHFFKKLAEITNIHIPFNANSMMLLSKYESVVSSDTKRMETFMRNLERFIESKARLGHKTCTYDIPEDLLHMTDTIITKLEVLGFVVLDEGKYSDAFKGSIGISWRFFDPKISTNDDIDTFIENMSCDVSVSNDQEHICDNESSNTSKHRKHKHHK